MASSQLSWHLPSCSSRLLRVGGLFGDGEWVKTWSLWKNGEKVTFESPGRCIFQLKTRHFAIDKRTWPLILRVKTIKKMDGFPLRHSETHWPGHSLLPSPSDDFSWMLSLQNGFNPELQMCSFAIKNSTGTLFIFAARDVTNKQIVLNCPPGKLTSPVKNGNFESMIVRLSNGGIRHTVPWRVYLKPYQLGSHLPSYPQGNPSCPPQSYPPSNKGLIRPY